jgi:hypothetical protein
VRHIFDAVANIRRIEARGDLTRGDILYDAALRNRARRRGRAGQCVV